MSYKVLARKWRPQHFSEMIGQESVLRAIVNALDTNRLHHAYLFTGMRGVGKTTIARIFAKCLNCETNGVSANPCGECSTCQDIENGRFFDLIEVDAASRTKVEETRELLENVPYAPSSGRYKVYLIDEVHMFSNHSFNALLKTLEEPPEHVKFLLATTDPQKVPVTVLSRCLQFNLKRMAPTVLVDYLQRMLSEESIECERPALDLIARASEGSVRDSLSLVEQAAAFGEGAVREVDVESMLGRASMDRLLGLIESLGEGDLPGLFSRVEGLAEYAPDFGELLGELLSLLHKIAMLQNLPAETSTQSEQENDRLSHLAKTIAADEIQLFYQIGMHARRDMPFAPDPREAFDMALLRMNSFRPQANLPTGGGNSQLAATGKSQQAQASGTVQPTATTTQPVNTAEAPTGDVASDAPSLAVRGEVSAGGSLRAAALAAALGEPAAEKKMKRPAETPSNSPSAPIKPQAASAHSEPPVQAAPEVPASAPISEKASPQLDTPAPKAEVAVPVSVVDKTAFTAADWPQIVEELDISGMPKQLATNMEMSSFDGKQLQMKLESSSEHLNTSRFAERVSSAFGEWVGETVRLNITVIDAELVTPARLAAKAQEEEMAAARKSIDQDPVVQQLIDRVDASVDPASIQPVSEH